MIASAATTWIDAAMAALIFAFLLGLAWILSRMP